jgi:four helix bundle protein
MAMGVQIGIATETRTNVQRSTSNVQRSKTERANDAFDLDERLLNYAAAVVRLTETMPDTRASNHIAGQLLRSGTSPLPNHGEAQAAESRQDFVHKFSICLQELRESRRWLRLILRVPLITDKAKVEPLIDETEEPIRIFAKSVRTAKTSAIERSKLNVIQKNR